MIGVDAVRFLFDLATCCFPAGIRPSMPGTGAEKRLTRQGALAKNRL
jgi:hypothetical protein